MRFLILILLAWHASAYEVSHEILYAENFDNISCPRGGQAFCATNGYEYELFENACRLEAKNLQRLLNGQPELSQVPLHYCQRNYQKTQYKATAYASTYSKYEHTRTYGADPVCAEYKYELRTFPNYRAMYKHYLSTGDQWIVIASGPCKGYEYYFAPNYYTHAYKNLQPTPAVQAKAVPYTSPAIIYSGYRSDYQRPAVKNFATAKAYALTNPAPRSYGANGSTAVSRASTYAQQQQPSYQNVVHKRVQYKSAYYPTPQTYHATKYTY